MKAKNEPESRARPAPALPARAFCYCLSFTLFLMVRSLLGRFVRRCSTALICPSAASTSAWNARAETRSAPWPRMMTCSGPSDVATRTRRSPRRRLVGRALDVGVGSLGLLGVDDLDTVHRLHTAGVALDLIGVEHDDDAALAKALIVGENADQRAARRGDILRGEPMELVPREDDVVAVDEQIFRVL